MEVTIKQRGVKMITKEQIEFRQGKIGGSDIPTILGLNKYKSVHELWCEKTGQRNRWTGNAVTALGNYLEKYVADQYSIQTGLKVRCSNKTHIHRNHSLLICHIDRWIVSEKRGVLECKTVNEWIYNSLINDGVAERYYSQLQYNLYITGKEWGALAFLNRNNGMLLIETYEYDDRYINEKVLPAVLEFADCILTNREPVHNTVTEYQTETAFEIDDPDWSVLVIEYLEANTLIGRAKKIKESAKTSIINLMQSNAVCTGAGVVCKIATRQRNYVDKKLITKEYPDVDMSKITTTKDYVSFSCKIKDDNNE